MSSTLVVVIPLALLGVAALLGFAGCALTHTGPPPPPPVPAPDGRPVFAYLSYQGTVLGTSGLVACWPLNEGAGATTAADISANHIDGAYTTGAAAALYDPVSRSARASGAVTPGQPGIVPGDTHGDPPVRATCPLFDGGFVSIPWDARINIPPPFTVEAWVRPTWTDLDALNEQADRGLVVSLDNENFTGFGIFATEGNYWSAVFGTTGGLVTITPDPLSNQKVNLGTTMFLVLTFDGTTATLYVNPADTTLPYKQGTVSGYVPLPSPTPMYIGTGRPNAPMPPSPGFPFTGYIQDVAIYNTVLDDMTIQTHYLNGNGMAMG